MLKDNFNRTIDYLRISITDRCNLRCQYCVDRDMPFVPHEEIIKHEEIIRLVRICSKLGVRKVRLTGGEPLVRKGIAYLIREISTIDGIEDIALTTNGVFLGDKLQELQEAGLKRVNISLDTLKKDRFRHITGVDALAQVLESIKKCYYSALKPIKINTVIIKGFNDDEILNFTRLAHKWDIETRFIEFMPFGDSNFWDASRIVPSETIEKIIREHYELIPVQNTSRGPAKLFALPDGKGKVGLISPVSSHICHECNRLRLTSRGMVRPCLFSDMEYDIKTLLRSTDDDDEVSRRLREIVKEKPEKKHETTFIKKCQRSMRNIGG